MGLLIDTVRKQDLATNRKKEMKRKSGTGGIFVSLRGVRELLHARIEGERRAQDKQNPAQLEMSAKYQRDGEEKGSSW